jgi:hypothetical protein
VIGAGASLIALLHYLANHSCDRLLIGHRHRRDHRGELVPGHVRAQPNRVLLEDATLTFKQPSEIYTVLLGKLTDLAMLELQDRLDLFVGKITLCGYPDALPHRLFKLARTRHCFAVGPARRSVEERDVVGDHSFNSLCFGG